MMDFNTSQKPAATGHNTEWSKAESSAAERPSTRDTATRPKTTSILSSKKIVKWVVLALLAILAIFIVRASYRHIVYSGIDTSRYQAVYLTNDNVYFGRVHMLINGDIFLSDVFRVQAATTANSSGQNTDSTTTNSATASSADTAANVRLIKPGKELHAPDDTMLIRRGSVLFMENLKVDGKVTQAIIDYHKQSNSN